MPGVQLSLTQIQVFSTIHASEFRSSIEKRLIKQTIETKYIFLRCELEATSATPGFCTGTCSNIYIYMALLAVIKFIVSFSTVGNLLIDLRSG